MIQSDEELTAKKLGTALILFSVVDNLGFHIFTSFIFIIDLSEIYVLKFD